MSADNLRTREPLTESSPDWQRARMLGRREALNIILEQNAEDFPDEFQRSCPIGDTGDFRAEWREDKLAKLLDAEDPSSLIEHLAGIRWEQATEIIELNAQIAAMCRAIKEAQGLIQWLTNNSTGLLHRTASDALAKLQPITAVGAPATEGGAA